MTCAMFFFNKNLKINFFKKRGDLPGSPVVKILPTLRGHSSILGWETKVPHAPWSGQKKAKCREENSKRKLHLTLLWAELRPPLLKIPIHGSQPCCGEGACETQ